MLIPHEFTHSWNGKFRRPYGEDVHSSTAPQSADLIWVYEGLTEYLGDVLMVRAGFRSFAAWRHDLLGQASSMRYGTGREWESLADTALVAPYTYVQGAGTALHSINDVYYESELVWLEAAGWKLTSGEKPEIPSLGMLDYRLTFGAYFTSAGQIAGVIPGSLAERAGMEDGMKALGVNGSLFTMAVLQEAVRATKGSRAPLDLLVAHENKYRTLRIEGLNGERFPVLQRDPARPDLLSAITARVAIPLNR